MEKKGGGKGSRRGRFRDERGFREEERQGKLSILTRNSKRNEFALGRKEVREREEEEEMKEGTIASAKD